MLKDIFRIDFNRMVTGLMIPDHRQPKYIAWLVCLIMPIKMIYTGFSNNRSANIYNLAHNGQVCYLRKVLNDTFDPSLRRIRIGNGNKYERQYIYTNVEQQPKYLGTMYLRQSGDYADTGVDFRVILPVGYNLTPVLSRMKAIIEYYKLASKRYLIQYENE